MPLEFPDIGCHHLIIFFLKVLLYILDDIQQKYIQLMVPFIINHFKCSKGIHFLFHHVGALPINNTVYHPHGLFKSLALIELLSKV